MEQTGKRTNFRKLDKSLRMQTIVDTATELFSKKGYRSTSLDDVAKKLGITKAALYHYVAGKTKLLSIIYLQALEKIFKNTYHISAMDIPADEKLKLLIENHLLGIVFKGISMTSVFFTEENQLPAKDLKRIKQEQNKYNRVIEQTIEEGISQGIFRKSDSRLHAQAILGMCNWVYQWYKPERSPHTPEEITDHFITLLEKGYLKESRKETTVNLKASKEALKKNTSGDNKGILEKLKLQCENMIKLIEKIEGSG